MAQGERWLANWKAVMDFMEPNHRRPSKLVEASAEAGRCRRAEDRTGGDVQPDIRLGETYKHNNQYQ